MDSQDGAQLIAVDEDPQLPVAVVSKPYVKGERREWTKLSWRVSYTQRFLAPPRVREDHNPYTYHGDQPNCKCFINIRNVLARSYTALRFAC